MTSPDQLLSPLQLLRTDDTERNTPTEPEPVRLGARIREIRQRTAWTLEELSRRTGITKSTLSKIENDQVSPTFEVVQKLAAGLGIEIPQLFAPTREKRGSGRRVITRKGDGRIHPTPTYEHELLATALSRKRMVPFKTVIRARSFEDFTGWVRHVLFVCTLW